MGLEEIFKRKSKEEIILILKSFDVNNNLLELIQNNEKHYEWVVSHLTQRDIPFKNLITELNSQDFLDFIKSL